MSSNFVLFSQDCFGNSASFVVPYQFYAKAFDCVDHNKLWKILKEKEISEYLTCLLRNLYVGQEAAVRTGHEQQTGSKSGKDYFKAVYCHPAYLTYMQDSS